ncbi:MAG: hypothetical protein AAGI69_28215 [Cyanobacteria bacterium P01_H01_bin.21]
MYATTGLDYRSLLGTVLAMHLRLEIIRGEQTETLTVRPAELQEAPASKLSAVSG